MKKYLSIGIVLVMAIVFAGCQPKTATYKKSKSGANLIENAQAFVHEVTEKGETYTPQDWTKVMDQFKLMCEDYDENFGNLGKGSVNDFLLAIREYMAAVRKTESDKLILQAKNIMKSSSVSLKNKPKIEKQDGDKLKEHHISKGDASPRKITERKPLEKNPSVEIKDNAAEKKK